MSHMRDLKDKLYGQDGLDAMNFKLFPGTNREVTADQIAEQLNAAFGDLLNGEALADESE